MRTVCNELGTVKFKWFKIGVQLDIPQYVLKQFEKDEDDPLSAAVDYWLKGNVTDSDLPISWKSIVDALKSEYVGERGLAESIRKKYCLQEESKSQHDLWLSY